MKNINYILRFIQIAVACIPIVIGFLALLNNVTGFHGTVEFVVKPLITMQGNTSETWRALPSSFSPIAFIFMLIFEFIVGILALIGCFLMIKNLFKDSTSFENAKAWVYLACGWGIVVWGLFFFTIGGDWFLSWKNSQLSSFQQGALMYVFVLLAACSYLKLSKEH